MRAEEAEYIAGLDKTEKANADYRTRVWQSLAHWLGAIKRKAFGRSVVGEAVKKLQTKSPIPCYSLRII
jgi:hypothetical protein